MPAAYPDAVVPGLLLPIDSNSPHLTDGVRADETLVLVGSDVAQAGSIWSFSMADLEQPQLLGHDGSTQLMGVCWSGDHGYATELYGGPRPFTLEADGPRLGESVPPGGGGGRIDCDERWVAWGLGSEGGAIAPADGSPTDPLRLDGDVRDVLLEGDRLWTLGYDGLSAYDLSSGIPVLLDSLALDGTCTDLAAHAEMLVAGCGSAGVVFIERGDGTASELGRWEGHLSPRTVAVVGGHVVVSAWDEWVVLDVSVPSTPVLVAAEAAPTAASAAVAWGDADLVLVDWKRPQLATLQSALAPEARLDQGYVRPGDVLRVSNDGPETLCLGTPSVGSIDRDSVPPGDVALWSLPDDLAEGSVAELPCNDADEGTLTVEVGSLQGLAVGDPAPDFVEVDLDGVTWALEALRGQVVFLGLLDAW